MKALSLFLIGMGLTCSVWAETPLTAEQILQKIDQNRISNNMISTSSFIIHGVRGSRTIKAKSWAQGTHRSFTEYLDPPREKGTKMLKIEDELWTYYPRADRIVKIAGHMLRQSVAGSDLSYEDMLENSDLASVYESKIEGETEFLNRPCWILTLKAKHNDAAYQARKIWVDQERFLQLKEELYTKSGKLLKVIETQEMFQIQDRWYPKKLRFKDVLKEGKGTEFHIHTIEFDAEIPDSRFSKAALRR